MLLHLWRQFSVITLISIPLRNYLIARIVARNSTLKDALDPFCQGVINQNVMQMAL